MGNDIFDLLDEMNTAPTDYTRSFTPAVIGDGKALASEKRAWLLTQFKRARKVGMGISTVQILLCLRSTVAPARVWELVQDGWEITNRGRCTDGSDLYTLDADEQGKPIIKLLGWEGSLHSTGMKSESHAHKQGLNEEERVLLDTYMNACLRAWVKANKPDWSKLCP